MSFINAVICGGPGVELEYRMHMRYEFITLGLDSLVEVGLQNYVRSQCQKFCLTLFNVEA